MEAYGRLPLSFEANQGQMDKQVKFFSRGAGFGLYLTPMEAVLQLHKPAAASSQRKALHPDSPYPEPDSVQSAVLRMKLLGAKAGAQVEGLDRLPGKSNYFIGTDPSKWRTDVPSYAKVTVEDVYPAIDLVYYGNQRQLEHHWIVKPGADPKAIRFAVEGEADLKVDIEGDLLLDEKGELRLRRPLVYQRRAGCRREIAGRYILHDKREVGFQLDKYDDSLPLVIDPVLSYSTYLMGTDAYNGGDEYSQGIAVDSSGNTYIAGSTFEANFTPGLYWTPATEGGFVNRTVKVFSSGTVEIKIAGAQPNETYDSSGEHGGTSVPVKLCRYNCLTLGLMFVPYGDAVWLPLILVLHPLNAVIVAPRGVVDVPRVPIAFDGGGSVPQTDRQGRRCLSETSFGPSI